jgi:hypothetical protein
MPVRFSSEHLLTCRLLRESSWLYTRNIGAVPSKRRSRSNSRGISTYPASRYAMMAVMAVTMMYRRWCKHLAQNFFLQLPVDCGNTPTAMMLHRRPCLVLATKIILALETPVILLRVISRAHPRVRSSRSRWQSKEIIRNNVPIVLEYDLWNWHNLLFVTDHALLILILRRLIRTCRFLLRSSIFLCCRRRVGTFHYSFIFLLLFGSFPIRDIQDADIPKSHNVSKCP